MTVTYAKFESGDCETIPYTPVSAVAAGDVVVVGNNVFFAKVDIAAGVLGALHIGGLWELPCLTGSASAMDQGDLVYWDATSHTVTETAGSNKKIGIVAKDAVDADTKVTVMSIPQAV